MDAGYLLFIFFGLLSCWINLPRNSAGQTGAMSGEGSSSYWQDRPLVGPEITSCFCCRFPSF